MEKIGLVVVACVFVLMSACQPAVKPRESGRSGADGTVVKDQEEKKEVEPNVVLEDEKVEVADDENTAEDEQPAEEPADCYKADQSICDMERQIFELTNELRKGRGLAPLTLSPQLSWSAREWSKDMGSRGGISHAGFPSARQRDFASEFGSSTSMSAENVAMTFSRNGSVAQDFFGMWEKSSGHRANMLSRNGTIGIGIAQNSRGGWYATQIFGR